MRLIRYTDDKGLISFYNVEDFVRMSNHNEKTSIVLMKDGDKNYLEVIESIDTVAAAIIDESFPIVYVTGKVSNFDVSSITF